MGHHQFHLDLRNVFISNTYRFSLTIKLRK